MSGEQLEFEFGTPSLFEPWLLHPLAKALNDCVVVPYEGYKEALDAVSDALKAADSSGGR
jgi:hypothetical protein